MALNWLNSLLCFFSELVKVMRIVIPVTARQSEVKIKEDGFIYNFKFVD